MARKRLGEILLERKLIDTDQLNRALIHHRQLGIRLGAALVSLGLLTEDQITRILADNLNIPMADLSRLTADKRALATIDVGTCEKFHIFPVRVRGKDRTKTLVLAMADPLNVAAIDEIGFKTNMRIEPVIAQMSSVDQAIQAHYRGVQIDIQPLGRMAADDDDEGMTLLDALGAPKAHVADKDDAVLELTNEVAGATFGENSLDVNRGTTGVFYRSTPPKGAADQAAWNGEGLAIAAVTDDHDFELLEKRFWALMRLMVSKGLITREEFLAEVSSAK